jgi:hypothetical protein
MCTEAERQAMVAAEKAWAAHEALEAMEVEIVCIVERERQAAVATEATAAAVGTLRLDTPEAADSEADGQMVL